MGGATDGGYRLDEIDRKIIYALMGDSRNTSAAAIAETVSVSDATVRNRIAQLEDHGIVEGYHAAIDFEHADGSLMNLFLCHAKFGDVEGIARKVGTIPGVINVRELLGGRINLHVLAVGADTAALRQIGRELEQTGVEVEDEFLLQEEFHFPYTPYGPSDDQRRQSLTDYLSLAGGAEIVELTVHENAPITGHTLQDATVQGLLEKETLIVAIERDDAMITPKGQTEIRANDIVTIFSPDRGSTPSVEAFQEPNEADSPNSTVF